MPEQKERSREDRQRLSFGTVEAGLLFPQRTTPGLCCLLLFFPSLALTTRSLSVEIVARACRSGPHSYIVRGHRQGGGENLRIDQCLMGGPDNTGLVEGWSLAPQEPHAPLLDDNAWLWCSEAQVHTGGYDAWCVQEATMLGLCRERADRC